MKIFKIFLYISNSFYNTFLITGISLKLKINAVCEQYALEAMTKRLFSNLVKHLSFGTEKKDATVYTTFGAAKSSKGDNQRYIDLNAQIYKVFN